MRKSIMVVNNNGDMEERFIWEDPLLNCDDVIVKPFVGDPQETLLKGSLIQL